MSDEENDDKNTTIAKVKARAALIAAIAALVTAAGSWLKPADTKIPKGIYDQLTADIKDVSKATVQNHNDIVALTNYMEGYLHWQEMSMHCPTGAVFDGTRCNPPEAEQLEIKALKPSHAIEKPSAITVTEQPVASASPPAPPQPGPSPKFRDPPNFTDIAAK